MEGETVEGETAKSGANDGKMPRPPVLVGLRRPSGMRSPSKKTGRRMSFKDLAKTSVNMEAPVLDGLASVVLKESHMARLAAKASGNYIDVMAIKSIVMKPPHERTDEELAALVKYLRPFKEFKTGPGTWSMKTKLSLCRCVTLSEYPPEAPICIQGDVGDEFFMILQGSVNVRIVSKVVGTTGNANTLTGEKRTTLVESDWAQVASLHSGESFGELALMRNEPRSATIVAGHSLTVLLVVKKFDYDASLKGLHLQEAANRISFLHRMPIFANWATGDLSALSLQMKKMNFLTNSLVTKQGDPASYIYFIVQGRCRILRRLHIECYQTSIICELGELSTLNWFGKVLLSSGNQSSLHDQKKKGIPQQDKNHHAGLLPGAGTAGGFYDCSVQATSNLLVYQLSREDVVRRSQQFLHASNAGSVQGLSSAGMIQPVQSDDKVNQAIEESIKWEVFKRQTVCNALSEKRDQFIQKQRNLRKNGNSSAMAHTRWIESIGEDDFQVDTKGLLTPIKSKTDPTYSRLQKPAMHNRGSSLKTSYLDLLESEPSVLTQKSSPRLSHNKSQKSPRVTTRSSAPKSKLLSNKSEV